MLYTYIFPCIEYSLPVFLTLKECFSAGHFAMSVPKRSRRVLIVKTSSLGDVVHALPTVTSFAQQGVRFDWLVEEDLATILSLHGAVDRVITVALRRWRRRWWCHATHREWRQWRDQLRTVYDAVVDLQGLIKSAWLSRYASGIGYGYDQDSARESCASRFYDQRIPVKIGEHAVYRNHALLCAALGECVALPDHYGLTIPQDAEADLSPFVVLITVASTDIKCWQGAYWRELMGCCIQRGWRMVLPWGNIAEKQRVEQLAAGVASHCLIPRQRLSLVTLASMLRSSHAVIALDTGLAHVAAAAGASRIIALYFASSPWLTGVWSACAVNLAQWPLQLSHSGCQAHQFAYHRAEDRASLRIVVCPQITPDKIMKTLDEFG